MWLESMTDSNTNTLRVADLDARPSIRVLAMMEAGSVDGTCQEPHWIRAVAKYSRGPAGRNPAIHRDL